MSGPGSLAQLAAACGILSAYFDVEGDEHHTSDATRRSLLAAMGVDASSDTAIERALLELEAERARRVLPAACVLRDYGVALALRLQLPVSFDDATLDWTIAEESGATHSGRIHCNELPFIDTVALANAIIRTRKWTLPVPLPHGYHRLDLECDGAPLARSLLIVAPPACYVPAAIEGDRRVWGPTAQLYTLRSRRNWGMGDFTDLAAMVDQWGSRGAGIAGTNPLHALFPDNPAHASPYAPSSRLFLNVQYLDPEAIEDFAECAEARDLVAQPAFQTHLASLRGTDLVDYPGVATMKREVLELLYASFRAYHLAPPTGRGRSFREFQAEGGRLLRLHALYDALQERFRGENPSVSGWHDWPEEYRHPDAPAVARFEIEASARVELFEYLQWQASLQLSRASHAALAHRMGIGLYTDLAVSTDRNGAEVWSERDCFALGASVGCPPDSLGPEGQDWGLPPFIPHRLTDAEYAPFIRLLRANMGQPGALRLDHVMGLMRLFWIPRGAKAVTGAYVAYPFEDLLGILALESHRNRCLVIGEDLGTVPDEVRHAMAREGILSYRVLLFEREHDGEFKAPARYEAPALVTATTHDLPTLAGFWAGRDLALRESLGLFKSEAAREVDYWNRGEDRARLARALAREGLGIGTAGIAPGSRMPSSLPLAVHAFLARTPSKVMVVQLEDVVGVETPVNLPGVAGAYPNWRRKLPLDVEDFPVHPVFQLLTDTLRAARGADGAGGGES